MSRLRWEEPPPSRPSFDEPLSVRKQAKARLRAALRRRPGEWVLWAEDVSPNTGTAAKNAAINAGIEFRIVSRVDVYARYVGEEG